jgi:AAA domain
MNFRLQKLVIQFGKSREEIELDHHLTIFHGKISSGKSTIAKLIDACLGGSPGIPRRASRHGFDFLSAGSNKIIATERQTLAAPKAKTPHP